MRAVLLFSGGLDSTTCLAIARSEGFEIHALSIDYGQRHAFELQRARQLGQEMRVASHRVVRVDLGAIGGSALTDARPVPKDELGSTAIPSTYVPARNSLFLTLALGLAEVLSAVDLFIGANAIDYSGYPDCRPEFLEAFERMANLATAAGVGGSRYRIHAPLLRMSKAEIIQRGVALGVDYQKTHSCYDPDSQGRACGHCDSCLLRSRGFHEAGVPDPTVYAP